MQLISRKALDAFAGGSSLPEGGLPPIVALPLLYDLVYRPGQGWGMQMFFNKGPDAPFFPLPGNQGC